MEGGVPYNVSKDSISLYLQRLLGDSALTLLAKTALFLLVAKAAGLFCSNSAEELVCIKCSLSLN